MTNQKLGVMTKFKVGCGDQQRKLGVAMKLGFVIFKVEVYGQVGRYDQQRKLRVMTKLGVVTVGG